MDQQIFFAINNLAGRNQMLDGLAVFLAEYFWWFLIAAVLILWWRKIYVQQAMQALLAALVSRVLFVELIKRLIDRPRPFEVLEATRLIEKETGVSFPSGHTVVVFALAFAFYGTKWFWPMFTAAVLVALSRIFAGVHYPSDILGSVAIAGLTVWLVRKFWKKKIT